MRSKRDYLVGYGKPPKQPQYKPGQSGNISGRPKRKEIFSQLIYEELRREVVIIEDGTKIKVTRLRALAKAFVHNGIKGSARDRSDLCKLIQQYGPEWEAKVRAEAASGDANDFTRFMNALTQNLSPNGRPQSSVPDGDGDDASEEDADR